DLASVVAGVFLLQAVLRLGQVLFDAFNNDSRVFSRSFIVADPFQFRQLVLQIVLRVLGVLGVLRLLLGIFGPDLLFQNVRRIILLGKGHRAQRQTENQETTEKAAHGFSPFLPAAAVISSNSRWMAACSDWMAASSF